MPQDPPPPDEGDPFDLVFHVGASGLEEDTDSERLLEAIRTLRSRLENECSINEAGDLYEEFRGWCTDSCLRRFIVARKGDTDKAFEMLIEALKWRHKRQPHLLSAEDPAIMNGGRTGKAYIAGFDRWKRPVVVLDNAAENERDPTAIVTYTAFNLEFAVAEMGLGPPAPAPAAAAAAAAGRRKGGPAAAAGLAPPPPPGAPGGGVEKYCIFVHMERFSFLNIPPLQVSAEACQMLSTCFPERLGHIVIWRPPAVFWGLLSAMRPFVDDRTMAKVVFAAGTPGDEARLRGLIGDNWKEMCGVDQPVIERGASPGFNFETYWPRLVEREHKLKQAGAWAPGQSVPRSASNSSLCPSVVEPLSDEEKTGTDEQKSGEGAILTPPKNRKGGLFGGGWPWEARGAPNKDHGGSWGKHAGMNSSVDILGEVATLPRCRHRGRRLRTLSNGSTKGALGGDDDDMMGRDSSGDEVRKDGESMVYFP